MYFRGSKPMKSLNLVFTIVIGASLLSATTTVSFGATNVIPTPREQMDSGINAANVVCKAGYVLIVRATSDTAACVKKSSSDKLIENGWATKLSALLEKKPQLSSIGDVKTVKIVPIFVDKKRQDTTPGIVTGYNYVFEACSKSSFIRAPEILVTSDSETKIVKLSENIPPKSCQTSATLIKATDKDSIKASLVKKTDLVIIVGELESRVTDLKERLAVEKKSIATLAKQESSQSPDYKKKVSEKTDLIISLRNELNAARADLQKNQYALIVGSKAPLKVQPISDMDESTSSSLPVTSNATLNTPYVKKINTISQYSDAGRLKSDPLISSFSFVFDACAGKDNIMFPQVMIRSDSEIKSVQMSESLDAHTCQTSSTIIKASDKNSIKGMMVTSGDISKSISELESKVASLKESIAAAKKTLSDLVKQSPAPEDLQQQATDLTDKIVQQRNELNQAKQELTSLKYMIIE